MKKIDFRKIQVADIEGRVIPFNIAANLGNMLYMQGQNIEECELGRTIYQAGKVKMEEESNVELTSEQLQIVKNAMRNFSYIVRSAVLKELGIED